MGTAIAEALLKAGHTVDGLARSPEKAKQLEARGIHPVLGDLLKPETLAESARSADGIIHTANTNDANAPRADRAATRTMLEALKGSGKPFVYSSGIWVLGSTGKRMADEQTPMNPPALVAHRFGLEREVLAYKDDGVRAIVIRPAAVYGRGGGLLNMLVDSARQSGAARFVGNGENYWPFVDVDDLAQLYVLALEKAAAGSLYIGAHGPSYRMRDLAEAASIGAGANGKVEAWAQEDARKTLGTFADALVLDQQASGEKAKRELGWTPRGRSVLDELKTGSYARRAAAGG